MKKTHTGLLVSAALVGPWALACVVKDRADELSGSGLNSASASADGGGSAPGDGATSGVSASASGTSNATATATATGGDGPKLDVGSQTDLTAGNSDSDSPTGCQKIDFLFVVDNSGSMGDEQTALANSFPGFISSIQNTVMAQDYHIMVIDSDASGGGSFIITCSPDPPCCMNNCAGNPGAICNGLPCTPPQSGCDGVLGGARMTDPTGVDCGIVSGYRWMNEAQPDLTNTFTCLAEVGTSGDGNERPMEAMETSLTTLHVPGECNEEFLRDDAILVVTFITDEEDNGKSAGTAATWKDALVTVKNGDENAIVMLGVLGDTGIAGTPCAMSGEAEDSPNLRTFADSFNFGSWGSVCAADYAPFFDAAVSVIDNACDIFDPPG